MELMNEAATNIGESAPFSDITINQWREAEKIRMAFRLPAILIM